MIASAAALSRAVRDALLASPSRVALAWSAATFLALALLGGRPGISRDEAAVLERTDVLLRTSPPAAPAPAAAPSAAPSPPLAAYAAAVPRAALAPLGMSTVRAARLGTALLGAVLSAALALLAWETSGGAAALLAPALFWAAPRHLHAGLVATPDLALAALTVAAVLAWRRAGSDPDGRRRVRAAARAGVLFGLALAARTDAWVLVPALALHAAASRALGASPPSERLERRLPLPAALVAMAVLGPIVLLALWPSVLSDGARAFARRGALSASEAIRVTALTLPATALLAALAGVGLSLLRILLVSRRRAPAPSAADEVLLLLCAAAPFLAAAAGLLPPVAGVRPWLHAMPFLALLGARALLSAARLAWPARAAPLAASLALLVLWPGVRAAAHFHPAGSSAWNEIAGGAPGAAALGMRRQDGGEAAAAALEAVNRHARGGARVFWASSAPAAVRALARDGRIRSDLALADDPHDADIAVVTVDGGSRDEEYRTWSAFRTARPAAGVYLDEVPLALVYARPGAWR